MSILERIHSLASHAALYMARRSDRALLLQLDDRTLADINISRALLEAGVAAWPWRADEHDQAVHAHASRLRTAMDELQAYSDAELADIGVARGSISEAVLHGRRGIESGPTAGLAEAA